MRILAVETSTMFGGIAIMDESEGLLAELRLNIRSTHSERLMTGINLLLQPFDRLLWVQRVHGRF